jgi:hypothetical protein
MTPPLALLNQFPLVNIKPTLFLRTGSVIQARDVAITAARRSQKARGCPKGEGT